MQSKMFGWPGVGGVPVYLCPFLTNYMDGSANYIVQLHGCKGTVRYLAVNIQRHRKCIHYQTKYLFWIVDVNISGTFLGPNLSSCHGTSWLLGIRTFGWKSNSYICECGLSKVYSQFYSQFISHQRDVFCCLRIFPKLLYLQPLRHPLLLWQQLCRKCLTRRWTHITYTLMMPNYSWLI